jgi:putative toxin-antitoxin system antitoxin component (TIGR02293 family)
MASAHQKTVDAESNIFLDQPEPEESSVGIRASRLHRLRALAADVWGNQADADEWLRAPHMELDGKAPISFLSTAAGTHRVEVVLSALDNGFPV